MKIISNPLVKNFIFVVLIIFIISGVSSLFYNPSEKPNQISISQLVTDINEDKVKKITVSGESVNILYIFRFFWDFKNNFP